MKKCIPLTTLALVTTAGCSKPDPMIGSWDCTSWTYEAQGVDECPYVVTDDDNGMVYTYNYGMDILSPKVTDFVFFYTRREPGPPVFIYEDSDAVRMNTEVLEKGKWTISEALTEIDLTCTAEGEVMDCDGTFYGSPVSIAFGPGTLERVDGGG